MRQTPRFHVYAEDGFESAHRSEAAARRAADRGAKRRGVEYRVVRCSAHGMTGGGHGTVVYTTRKQEHWTCPSACR